MSKDAYLHDKIIKESMELIIIRAKIVDIWGLEWGICDLGGGTVEGFSEAWQCTVF